MATSPVWIRSAISVSPNMPTGMARPCARNVNVTASAVSNAADGAGLLEHRQQDEASRNPKTVLVKTPAKVAPR